MKIIALAAVCLLVGSCSVAVNKDFDTDLCREIKNTTPTWAKERRAFAGEVRYVGDGDSLCVARQRPFANMDDHNNWVEVRLADFYAPELSEPGGRQAKATLSHLSINQKARCVPVKFGNVRSYDRIVAKCYIGRRSLGDLMRRAGIKEGGRGS